jgi:hypothetical protein
MKELLLTAVHEHEGGAETPNEKVPPPAGTLMVCVVTMMSQSATWFTVTVWPAMVRVPVRGPCPPCPETVNVTLPLPVPLAALVTVTKDALLTAVHPHALGAVTVTVAVPPISPNVTDVVDRAYVHASASWFTVTVWPPMVSVPARADPVLAWTEKVTVPLSFPELPELTVMKASLLLAVHAQPVAWAAMVTVPVPPLDRNEKLVALSVNVHTVRCNTISRRVFEEIDTVSCLV